MNNIKHAYYYNTNGEPCYTQYNIPHSELEQHIKNNKAIVLNDVHPHVKNGKFNHSHITAFKYNFDSGDITIDIRLYKKLIISRLRNIRDLNLQELDNEQIKYLGNIDKLIKIESVKQQLRDVMPIIEKSINFESSITNIDNIFPPILYTFREMIK